MRRNRRNKRKLMSEINMTPLIDVMLVLLVIFMITAPLLASGVKVNLPKVSAPSTSNNDTPIIVSIGAEGKIFVGEVETDIEDLPAKLSAISLNRSEQPRIFVKGDRNNFYGRVMEIMGKISMAGFKKVVLVTEDPRTKKQNNSESNGTLKKAKERFKLR